MRLPRDRATLLWGAAFGVALASTLGSLALSGIGVIGWAGAGVFPCELCWYQRILMYPLVVIIGVGLARRDRGLVWYVLPLSIAGFLVAGYHVFLQAFPAAEAGRCIVGSCTEVDRRFPGGVTIPQASLAAFALISALAIVAHLARADGDAESPT